MEGKRIGNYRVVRKLGEGGMGAVYEAVNDQVGRRAAVKVLKPELSRDPEMSARFANEARAASLISHPGIVAIYDVGQLDDGAAYIIMDYLEGDTLRARMPSSPGRPEPRLLRLFQQTASALAAAHAKGIVHRDLKPDNVMVVADPDVSGGERIKLVDFGIAKLAQPLPAPGYQTRTGAMMGTPVYMAPEQCRGSRDVGDRADVYALGIMLYQALAGRPPFQADSLFDLMSKHISEPPPPLAPETPPTLRALCERMLAKDPVARPAMREVAQALERQLGGEVAVSDTLAASPPPTRRVPIFLFAGALTVLAGAGAAILFSGNDTTPPPPPTPPAPPPAPATPPGMVLIPGAQFTLGSSPEEITAELDVCTELELGECDRSHFEEELVAHSVTVSSFYLDTHEVTRADYLGFARQVRGLRKDTQLLDERGVILADEKGYTFAQGAERLPAGMITWAGAKRFCEAAGKRLPTEAEWELAARGGKRRFPWGDEPAACELVRYGRAMEDCHGNVDPHVGGGPGDVTPEGIHDLGGNVAEWVADAFRAPYPDCDDPCRDPRVEKGDGRRVVRGASFFSPRSAARGKSRGALKPDHLHEDLGFRCAMDGPR